MPKRQRHRAKTAKQTIYQWQGRDTQGQLSRGEIVSNSLAHAKAQLNKQGIKPGRIKKKAKPLFSAAQKIKPLDIALFTRQLATMMKAGIPLMQSFDITAESLSNISMRNLVNNIRDDVAAGNNLASALRKRPQHFDALYCNLIEAGEQSGTLDTMLEKLAVYKEKSEALKSKLNKALHYPLLVMAVAIIVSGILLVKVVPQFAQTFSDFGAELPLITQYVMRLSDGIITYCPWALLVIISTGVLCRQCWRNSKIFAENMERMLIKLPIFGHIAEQSAVARFSRTLSTTFSAGVPLTDALQSASGAAGNVIYREAIHKIQQDVISGRQLALAIRGSGHFPAIVVQMVAIGEESGMLDDMLEKCAIFHEAEVDNVVDSLSAMMEPLIMSILGLLVGGLMIAMYLPIFQLGSVV